MHSEADEVVPFGQAQKAFSLLTVEHKQLKCFKGTGHNDIFSRHQASAHCCCTAQRSMCTAHCSANTGQRITE